ncbi:MAG: peptidyl-prolyl cis-trans isomerase SurA [Pseudomonadales bacterium]|jgi:peptidyl-prolyl cis-trans isomerase SurA
MNIKAIVTNAVLITSLIFSLNASSAEVIDRVAVVVDDDVIMATELEERVQQIAYKAQQQGSQLPPASEIRKQVMDQMILESLQLQMGRRAGVRISDQQLNQAMDTVAKNMGSSLDQFRQSLEADGSYNETREQIRRELILRQVQSGNISGKVIITDLEVDAYLDSVEGDVLKALQYRVTHIMLPLEEGEDKAGGKVLLSKAATEINDGVPLLQWLDIHNRSGKAPLQGGDLGWRKTDDLPSIFAEIVPTLDKGEAIGPIESGAGLHVVQVTSISGGEKLIEQTHARHILVKPSQVRSDQQCEDLLADLRSQIINGDADFADLAQANTEDIGSAQEGGDLGWASPGQFVPAFEEALARTNIDEVTMPFKSQFGWHIIQVLERRDHDVSQDLLRQQAYGKLYERKFSTELETWLQRIRDEAYVDIKATS